MTDVAIQDFYPEEFSHCHGCGRLNADGLHIRSFWDGGKAVATFTPAPQQMALPGYVYGGLIASLLDCHGIGTAAAAAMAAQHLSIGSGPTPRYVTAALRLNYLRPTPMGVPLELEGRPREVGQRKVVVDVSLSAGGETCVSGEVVAVRMPESMGRPATP